MAFPVPRPHVVIGTMMSVVGRAAEAAATVVALPVRTRNLLDATELLVTRFIAVMDAAEVLLDRTTRMAVDAEDAIGRIRAVTAAAALAIEEATRVSAAAGTVVVEAQTVAERAGVVVARTDGTAAVAGEVLAAYEPALRRAAPMADRFVGQLSQEEVDAAIRLIDELPKLTDHLTSNVLPILGTLDRVGPDIHDLLEVTRDLKLAIAGIPGLGMLRRRGEDRLAEAEFE
jgi:hypothetical protein